MIGTNTLKLNAATVNAAVEKYLNTVFAIPDTELKVLRVEQVSDEFVVECDAQSKKKS